MVNGQIYHVFNRSIASQPIFLRPTDFKRALEIIDFYRFIEPQTRFSHYKLLSKVQKSEYLESLHGQKTQVEILTFALMPNHFHFQLKQLEDHGISHFVSYFQNSYAKYLNLRTNRTGAVFQSMFKALRIETEEQLLHVARYIHLNPVTSYVIQNIDILKTYPWNSYSDYLNGQKHIFINKDLISSYFKSINDLQEFTENQIEYQRELEKIKHLLPS